MSDCKDIKQKCDLDIAKVRLQRLNRNIWWLEANDKQKLRTFTDIHDINDHQVLVKLNLSRKHQSLISKFKASVLPLGLELGRFKNTPLEYRSCCICEEGLLETEMHTMLQCEALEDVREKYILEINDIVSLIDIPGLDILRIMMSRDILKITGRFLEEMLAKRTELMYLLEAEELEEEE